MVLSDGLLRLDFAMRALYGRAFQTAPVFLHPNTGPRIRAGLIVLDDNIPQPWRARTTLVLTLTLLAMGLGNIQRMPFLMGEYGGAPFFVSYLIALCLLSVPVLIAEVTVESGQRLSRPRNTLARVPPT
ncbi:MAG: hypothetical protein CM15mP74_19350 [Halieaceae bacterium]|nr:MAG: hypothetical protein CM15mP74_19350 [Halieaceae bacterium]